MDRKEAEMRLKDDWYINLTGNLIVEHHKIDRFLEACGMGIKALQEPEIVHCKDCKHWYKEIMYCTYTGMQIEPHGYCVYGEVEE